MNKLIYINLFLLITLSSVLNAQSCTQHGFDESQRLQNEVNEKYNSYVHQAKDIQEKYNEIRWHEYDSPLTRKALKDINNLLESLEGMKSSLENLRRKYKKAEDYSYAVHKACNNSGDKVNAKTTYKSYEDFYNFYNANVLYGDNNYLMIVETFIESCVRDRKSIESFLIYP